MIHYLQRHLLNLNIISVLKVTVISFVAASLCLFAACKKDPSSIGLDIHPQSDKVTAATLVSEGISAYTFREDSISTDERSYALLGCYNDPVFGLSTASFVTQMRLLSFNTTFGTNAHADSMKILIDYYSYYGDTTQQQTFSVYEMANSIYPDSSYYSNFNTNNYVSPSGFISTHTYYPMPNDTTLVVSLPTTFAQKFIDAPSSVYEDNTKFLEFFKGFCFLADSTNPSSSIIYFNLLSTRTKVVLYYTNDSTSATYTFGINSNCARVNIFNHNYSASQVTGINDTVNINTNLFVQGMSGTGMRIFFPGLESWQDSGQIIISKAELVIPINTNFSLTPYLAPARLLNVAINSDKTYSFLPDYLVGEDYFDGNLNSSTQEYRFNIGRYIQQIVDGTREDYGIAVLCSDNRISANRVVINNAGSGNGIRLELYYFKP
jgi:hypothetical protein